MKNIKNSPNFYFFEAVWRQLAICYMPLAFGAITLLAIMLIAALENALTWFKRMAMR